MKIKKQKLPKNLLKMEVTFEPIEITPFYQKSLTEFAANHIVSGFRKGKAPHNLIEQEIGKTKITEKAAGLAIEHHYPDFLKQIQEKVVAEPEIQITKIAPGNELIVQLLFSIMPEVKIGDYKKIKITQKKVEIKKEEIETILKELQTSRASQTIKNGPAQNGDLLQADIAMFADKVPLENAPEKDAKLILGENRFLPEFSQKLLGAKSQETREFTLEYPKEYYDKKVAGKKIDFKVVIKNIFSLQLPDLNDEFAKVVSPFSSLAELKNKIEENLSMERKAKTEQKTEIEMLNRMIKECSFDEIPEVLKHQEIHKMLDELKNSVSNMLHMKLEDYLGMIKKTIDDLEKEFAPMAEERIKIALTIKKISEQEKLSASLEEIAEEKEHYKKHAGGDQKLLKLLETESFLNYLKELIANRKTIKFLKSQLVK
jgi:trigger factor